MVTSRWVHCIPALILDPFAGQVLAMDFKKQPKIVIGRSQDATWTIEHPSSSRMHAQITMTEAGPMLADLGSAHGTTRNGTKLGKTPVILKDGDTVVFGASTREYVLDMEAEGAKKPATFNPLSGPSGGSGLNANGNLAAVCARTGAWNRAHAARTLLHRALVPSVHQGAAEQRALAGLAADGRVQGGGCRGETEGGRRHRRRPARCCARVPSRPRSPLAGVLTALPRDSDELRAAGRCQERGRRSRPVAPPVRHRPPQPHPCSPYTVGGAPTGRTNWTRHVQLVRKEGRDVSS